MTTEPTDSRTETRPADSVEQVVVSVEALRVLCDATVRLSEIRQRGCSHLCVENFAPKCLRNLIHVYAHNDQAHVPTGAERKEVT